MSNVSPKKSTLNTPPRGSIKGKNGSPPAGAFNSPNFPGSPSRGVTTVPKDESKRIAALETELAAEKVYLGYQKDQVAKLTNELSVMGKEVSTLKSQTSHKDNQILLLKAQADEARKALEELKNEKTSVEKTLQDREVEWSAEFKKQQVAFIEEWNAREEELFAHIYKKKALIAERESELREIKEEWKKDYEEWRKAAEEGDQREAKLIEYTQRLEKEFDEYVEEYQKKWDLREKEWVGCGKDWLAIERDLVGKIYDLEVELKSSMSCHFDALKARDKKGDELRKAARDLARLEKELEEVNAARAQYQVYAERATIIGLAYVAYTSPAMVSAGVDLLFHYMGTEITFGGLNETLMGYGMELAAIGTGFVAHKGLSMAHALSEKAAVPGSLLNKANEYRNLLLLLMIVGLLAYYDPTVKGMISGYFA